jgi:hypothetical protein
MLMVEVLRARDGCLKYRHQGRMNTNPLGRKCSVGSAWRCRSRQIIISESWPLRPEAWRSTVSRILDHDEHPSLVHRAEWINPIFSQTDANASLSVSCSWADARYTGMCRPVQQQQQRLRSSLLLLCAGSKTYLGWGSALVSLLLSFLDAKSALLHGDLFSLLFIYPRHHRAITRQSDDIGKPSRSISRHIGCIRHALLQ